MIVHVDRLAAPGVRIKFERTGGVPITPDTIYAETNGSGRFRLQASAATDGVVVGTLTIAPPAPLDAYPFAVHGVEIPMSRVAGVPRYIGEWGVGPLPGPPRIDYVGVLVYADTGEPAGGVTVEARRVSGLAVQPAQSVFKSGSDGHFYYRPTSSGQGTLVADIVVRPQPPYGACQISGVAMAAFGVMETRYLGRWELAPAEGDPASPPACTPR